jgi:transposase-like protein
MPKLVALGIRNTEEFMAGAVRLALEEGKKIGAVAPRPGSDAICSANWIQYARADRKKGNTRAATSESRMNFNFNPPPDVTTLDNLWTSSATPSLARR